MPFYEYKCEKCNIKFEEFHEITSSSEVNCEKCGSPAKKLISISHVNCGLTGTNAREYYENVIRPEAKKIAQKIKNGDENAAADIFGEKKLFTNGE